MDYILKSTGELLERKQRKLDSIQTRRLAARARRRYAGEPNPYRMPAYTPRVPTGRSSRGGRMIFIDLESSPRRTVSEVLSRQKSPIGCCNRHADNMACDCLENAIPDDDRTAADLGRRIAVILREYHEAEGDPVVADAPTNLAVVVAAAEVAGRILGRRVMTEILPGSRCVLTSEGAPS